MSRSFVAVLVVILLGLGALVVSSYRSTPAVQGGLGDVRTVMAAEHAYAAANGGYFDEPSCLGAPARCIPGHPATGAPFVDPSLASLSPMLGYGFRFHAGPRPTLSAADRGKVSPTSVSSFAIVALPLEPASRLRAFCGDSTGRVCARGDGAMSDVKDGRCPEACDTLR